jgi:hypothetical protein
MAGVENRRRAAEAAAAGNLPVTKKNKPAKGLYPGGEIAGSAGGTVRGPSLPPFFPHLAPVLVLRPSPGALSMRITLWG